MCIEALSIDVTIGLASLNTIFKEIWSIKLKKIHDYSEILKRVKLKLGPM